MRRNASPTERRAYYAARYQRLKDQIQARYRERLANDPDFAEHERQRSREAQRRLYARRSPQQRTRRNRQWRQNRNLRIFGTTTPVKGTWSLDGTRRFGVRKDETWPKPAKSQHRSTPHRTVPSTSKSATAATPPSCTSSRKTSSADPPSTRSSKTSTHHLAPGPTAPAQASTASETPPAVDNPAWTPEPVSIWEPRLEYA